MAKSSYLLIVSALEALELICKKLMCCVCILENKFILKLGNKCIFAKRFEMQVGGSYQFL